MEAYPEDALGDSADEAPQPPARMEA